uniref:Calmodulin n=1 Tax=Macrostomum lignano TaxID=282301 RepID=A0A1I8FFP5_9PLAT
MQLHGCDVSESSAKKLLSEADSDGSGTLNFKEYCSMLKKKRKDKADRIAKLRGAFEKFDSDGSGYLDRGELKDALTSMGMEPLGRGDRRHSSFAVLTMDLEDMIDQSTRQLTYCSARNCDAVASSSGKSGICELLFINDASKQLGPPGTHVARRFGNSSTGELQVWKVADFEQTVQQRQLKNLTVVLSNSSTGRNGSVQHLTINITGCYRIEAFGAAGGDNAAYGKAGGRGASAAGSFNLTGGSRLSIVVGQAGGPAAPSTAGGGAAAAAASCTERATGSCTWRPVARWCFAIIFSSTSSGSNSTGGLSAYEGTGGANGQPGLNDPSAALYAHQHGGCGAGWLGRAVNARRGLGDGERGGGIDQSWVGGQAGSGSSGDGGFGGGGGGGNADNSGGAAGAGGGYSGGGAGMGTNHAGGGGGSFCGGVDCTAVTGGNSGSEQGRVEVRQLAAGTACG